MQNLNQQAGSRKGCPGRFDHTSKCQNTKFYELSSSPLSGINKPAAGFTMCSEILLPSTRAFEFNQQYLSTVCQINAPRVPGMPKGPSLQQTIVREVINTGEQGCTHLATQSHDEQPRKTIKIEGLQCEPWQLRLPATWDERFTRLNGRFVGRNRSPGARPC